MIGPGSVGVRSGRISAAPAAEEAPQRAPDFRRRNSTESAPVLGPFSQGIFTGLLPEKARGFWHGIEGERKQNSQRETYHCDQLGESSVMASIFFLA